MCSSCFISSTSATRTKTCKAPRGAIQTKHFIHDVNQQVATGFSLNEIPVKWSTGHIPVFTTAKFDLGDGGDRRDRTDDLKLAKLPLYQLSYVPSCFFPSERVCPTSHTIWWAWEDLNFRPHAYQARALTN